MRQVSITEYDDCVVVEILPDRVRYEFDSWEEAIEALPNLPETN